jgi:hypothetical protein
MSHPIWIVDGKLDFHDIIGHEPSYIEAWATIVAHWIFEPAQHLSSGEKVTDRGIALLTLELCFFEPFGCILTGEDSDNASQKTFCEGLKRFSDWLFRKRLIGDREKDILNVIGTTNAPNVVYAYARCGLMHKMTMQGGRIFVDARAIGRYSITNYKYKLASLRKDGSVEIGENILLIDPWRLLPQLKDFLKDFKAELCGSYPNGELYQRFKKTFERVIVAPGKIYFDL